MLGENDGPSMIAYASDGAQYGLGFFVPFIPILFAMAYVCQEMCMRVGAVTHRGYGELVLQRYGRVWGWFGAGDLTAHEPRHAGRRVRRDPRRARLLPPRLRRRRRARAGARRVHAQRRALLALGAHRARPGARSTACSCSPRSSSSRTSARSPSSFDFTPFPGGSFNTLLLLLASTIGATVTPWMIFFQQSASADKGMTPARRRPRPLRHRARRGARRGLRDRRADRRRGAADPRRLGHPGVRRRRLSAGARSTSPAAPPAPCSRSG